MKKDTLRMTAGNSRTIARNFSWLMTAQLVYKLLSLAGIAYMARIMGQAGFGQLSLGLSVGLLFLGFADMGQSEFFIRSVAGDPRSEEEMAGLVLGLKIVLGVILTGMAAGAAFFLGSSRGVRVAVMALCCAGIIDSFTLFLRSVFRAREKMHYEALMLIVEGALKLFLIIAAAYFFKGAVSAMGGAFLLASIIIVVLTVAVGQRNDAIAMPRLEVGRSIAFIRGGIPFAIVGILCVVNVKVDIIMLSKLAGDTVTGSYSAAGRLIESLWIIPATMAVAVFPALARLKSSGGAFTSAYYKLLFVSCGIGAAIGVACWGFSGLIVTAVFGTKFIDAVAIFRIFALMFVPVFVKLYLERVALVLHHARLLCGVYAGGLLLKIALNYLVMPGFGARGVAIATLATEIAMTAYLMVIIGRQVNRSVEAGIVAAGSGSGQLAWYGE
ncbi:MAG: flippase [Candidatus Omnitrophota bacterium]